MRLSIQGPTSEGKIPLNEKNYREKVPSYTPWVSWHEEAEILVKYD